MRNASLILALGVAVALGGCTCSGDGDSKNKNDKSTAKSSESSTDKPTASRSRPRLRRRISGEARAKRLQARFKLSDEQTKKLAEMFDSTPRREQRAKMKEIFTEDQWKQMQSARNRRGLRRRNPERRAEMLQKRLGLSDEQKTKLVDILKNTPRSERAAAFQKLLTKEQAEKWGKIRKRGRLRRSPFHRSAPTP